MDDDDLDELYEDVVDSQGSSDAKWMRKAIRVQVIQKMRGQSCLVVDLACGS